MVVDDDDFISRRLTSFVARHRDENGWYIRDGYIGRIMAAYSTDIRILSHLCGNLSYCKIGSLGLPNSL